VQSDGERSYVRTTRPGNGVLPGGEVSPGVVELREIRQQVSDCGLGHPTGARGAAYRYRVTRVQILDEAGHARGRAAGREGSHGASAERSDVEGRTQSRRPGRVQNFEERRAARIGSRGRARHR